MDKLILVHSQDPALYMAFIDKFTHHISCPLLFVLEAELEQGADVSTESVAVNFQDMVKAVSSSASCATIFLTNQTIMLEAQGELEKRFNIFHIWTRDDASTAGECQRGIPIDNVDEVAVAFNACVGWIFND